MVTRYEPKDMEAILDAIKTANDRIVITVSASLIDHSLEKLIGSRFRKPTTDKEKQVLFTDFGIIGTFSEKIWLAYFMKLIGPKTRHDLDMIRLIRNICSHDMNPVSFDQKNISSRVLSMTVVKRSPTQKGVVDNSARGMFTITSYLLILALFLRADIALSQDEVRQLDLVKHLDD